MSELCLTTHYEGAKKENNKKADKRLCLDDDQATQARWDLNIRPFIVEVYIAE